VRAVWVEGRRRARTRGVQMTGTVARPKRRVGRRRLFVPSAGRWLAGAAASCARCGNLHLGGVSAPPPPRGTI
jgi:hypothetical protein